MQPTQLDPKIKALTQAIRQTESGGNFQAVGKSGEYGAYQYTPETWAIDSKKYLGTSVNLKSATPEQQNEVMYKKVADLKTQGYNIGQIASIHNAGAGEPNAYTGTFSNGKPSVGTNSFGAKYDVPTYAKNVATAYQNFKQQGAQDVPQVTQPDTTPSVGGFVSNVFSSGAKVLGGLGEAVMHPLKTTENVLSTAAGGVEKLFGVQNQDTQNFDNLVSTYGKKYGGSSIGEVVHNIGHTLYTDPVGAALDLSVVLDGAGAALGAAGEVADVSKATELAKTSDFISSTKGILDSGSPEAIKALQTPGTLTKIADAVKTAADYSNPIKPVATAVAGTFKGVSDLMDALPRRIINNLLPQLKNSETIDYATSNLKLGSVDSMLAKSNQSLDLYDSSINSILTHPDYSAIPVVGNDIIQKTLEEFPNSEYTPEIILAKIKSQIPGSAALVTKLEKGSLSLEEANTLRQAIDRVTYKSIIDSPEVKAGKELAQAFGNALRNEVKTLAPESVPIFTKYSKEINLNKALNKLSLKLSKNGAVSMKELLGALGGGTLGGPLGAGTVLAGEKIINSPTFKVGAAKLLKNVAKPVAETVSNAVTKGAPLLKEAAISGQISNATKK